MNAHIPQSYEASTELAEIAAVPHQIVTPRHAKPLIGIVQDTLVGSYRLTRPQVDFNRREFMNMMMWNKRFNGEVPKASRGGSDGKAPRWTGHQVLSQLMPPINMEMGNALYKDKKTPENFVVIKEGQISQGMLDKDIFSKPSKGIVHVTFRDYGSKDTVNLIDSMQNTVEQFLVYNGFSVGISDLIADEETRKAMERVVKERKEAIEKILLQIHLDLFDNNTGKSNQQEFEDKVFTELNKATEESGKIGLSALSDENRLVAMVRAGSKGSTINISQMMACVGQQAPEGRRIPYGFTDRTLPHFKKYDDGAEARGFVESSFIQGLTPQEFFFHAMSGREGLIDTAVKSVTGDTEIVVVENGVTKRVRIGDWIDAHLAARAGEVEHFPEEADLEMLQLPQGTHIPSVNPQGRVSWGKVAAVTRHDPGEKLYRVETLGGREVIVTAAKSLLVWNPATKLFENKNTPDVRPGDCMPVTMQLAEPVVITAAIPLEKYLPKKEYLYGSDFHLAQKEVATAMVDREHIPAGWWNEKNGAAFTLPYENKGLFVRTLKRSDTENVQPGYVYPFTTNRSGARLPDQFELNETNGIFLGLFLAEGNVDVRAGSVAITNNNPTVRQFVHDWFESLRIKTGEEVRLNAIGGVTTTVRGYSTVLAKFLDELCGHGASKKRVPAEAFTASREFIAAILNGYFSGDGTVTRNSVEAGSASKELTEGIVMLLSRFGIFAKMFQTQLTENNLGTQTIQPSYRLSIRAQWATLFADMIELVDSEKQVKLNVLAATREHRNFPFQGDCVLDEIVEIEPLSPEAYPKMYDLTVPETFTFGLANGLMVYDTADTGYIQRQLVKAMEDLTVQYDGSVRDSRMNVVQFKYGEDGINATKIESASLGLTKLSDTEIRRDYGLEGVDITPFMGEGSTRGEDTEAMRAFAEQVLADRKMLVEGINKSRQDTPLYAPVNLDRLILNTSTQFRLDKSAAGKTDLTPAYVLAGIERLIQRTQSYHKLWAALLRFHLAPHKMIVKERFTRKAFDALCEMVVVRNWQGWAQPGEQVGIIAAQSIGEPSTQMTLNTFHLAGVAAKSNVTRGVPRLKELLKVTHNPKAISLTVTLKPEYRESRDKARKVTQDLELTLLKDITVKAAIYYDPKEDETVLEEDRDLIRFYKVFEEGEKTETAPAPSIGASDIPEEEAAAAASADAVSQDKWSKLMLRLEMDREKMFQKNITMDDIAFVLREKFGEAINMIYSDYNSQKLVMRIRVPSEIESANPKASSRDIESMLAHRLNDLVSDASRLDDLIALKKLQNRILTGIVVRGVPGIKAVSFRQDKDLMEYNAEEGVYKQVTQYILDTDGTNFLAVMNHPYVDGLKLTSSHVHDVYENLGIEATRSVLIQEITTLFEEAGVNYRHLGLLCDVMTRNGKLMSVDRNGINKMDIGPLAKASFEETEKILLRAALFGEMDPVTGISANIMMGQTIRGGTGFFSILLDEAAFMRLQKDSPEGEGEEEEEDFAAPTEEQMEAQLYGMEDDICSTARLQMNVALPQSAILMEEPDVELNVIDEGDESEEA